MKTIYVAALAVALATAGAMSCQKSGQESSVGSKSYAPVYTFLDVPIAFLHEQTEKYMGVVFEDRFTFEGLYNADTPGGSADSKKATQGKPFIEARPIAQTSTVIQIQITPGQEERIKKMGVVKQDLVKAKIRFAGIGPGGNLVFDLIEIME